jgi:hypothetical protein
MKIGARMRFGEIRYVSIKYDIFMVKRSVEARLLNNCGIILALSKCPENKIMGFTPTETGYTLTGEPNVGVSN